MKKKILISVLSILSIIVIVSISSLLYVTISINNITTYDSRITVDKETNTLSTDADDIKILQLADLQYFSYFEAARAFNVAKKTIKQSNPDFIVLTGDNISFMSNKSHLNLLVKFMDSFTIPWALVFGNHDYDSLVSISDQCKAFENSKYGIFKTGNVTNSYGNYYYTLQKNNQSIYSFLFMDSGKNGFNSTHVTWYENTIHTITEQNNQTIVPSLVFFHIPTEELCDAYKLYQKDSSIGSGEAREKLSVQENNVGFFQKAVELQSTKALVYGHDHINNLIIEYQGIQLCYGLKTGKTAYYNGDMIGANLYTINTATTELTIDRIYI